MNGLVIKQTRERLKLSQKEFSCLLNCSSGRVSQLENNINSLTCEELVTICKLDKRFSITEYLEIDVLNDLERTYVSKLERIALEKILNL